MQDGEIEQRKVVALDDLFAGAGGHCAREEFSCFRQQGQHLELVEKSLRGLDVHEHADAGADFVVGIHAHRQLHARVGAELVDQELRSGVAFQVLEEKSGTAGNAAWRRGFWRRGR